jgi:hypothetical protein
MLRMVLPRGKCTVLSSPPRLAVEVLYYMSMRAVLLALLAQEAYAAYYIPGVTPTSFADEEPVILNANKVTSTKTPVQYDYYDLPFCRHSKFVSKADSIGDRLSGDSLTRSPYEVSACMYGSVPRIYSASTIMILCTL